MNTWTWAAIAALVVVVIIVRLARRASWQYNAKRRLSVIATCAALDEETAMTAREILKRMNSEYDRAIRGLIRNRPELDKLRAELKLIPNSAVFLYEEKTLCRVIGKQEATIRRIIDWRQQLAATEAARLIKA